MNNSYFHDDFSDQLSSQDGLSTEYEEVNPFADIFSSLSSTIFQANDSFNFNGYADPYQDDHLQATFSNLNFEVENELMDNPNGLTTDPYQELNKQYTSSPCTYAQEVQKAPTDTALSDESLTEDRFQNTFVTSHVEEQYLCPSVSSKKSRTYSDINVKTSVREPTCNILVAQTDSLEAGFPLKKSSKEVSTKFMNPNDDQEAILAQKTLPEDMSACSTEENGLNKCTGTDGVQSILEISVCDPQRVGDPINPYIVYKVKTQYSTDALHHGKSSVTRRYRDFLWLYNQLTSSHPGVIIPPVPAKHMLGRFQDEFIESRRVALEKYLQKVAAHPKLLKDSDFLLFLESENFNSEVRERSNTNSKGLMKMFEEVVLSATNFSKFVETDEWLEKKRAQLDVLESQLKPLAKVFESFIKHRKALSGTYLEFSQSIQTLASAEPNKPFINNLKALSDVQKKIKGLQDMQAAHDASIFESTLDEYLRTVGSARLAFNARIKSYQSWQNSMENFNQKKVQLEKLRNLPQNRDERIVCVMKAVKEARNQADQDQLKFITVTETLRYELTRFDNEKAKDFKRSLEKYLRSVVSIQTEIVLLWETYLNTMDQAQ